MERVYRECKVGLSKDKLAKFMWAVLVTNARINTQSRIFFRKYSQKQMSRGVATVEVNINSLLIDEFETLAETSLFNLPKPDLNA